MMRNFFLAAALLLVCVHASAQTTTYSLPLTCNSTTHLCTLTPVYASVYAQKPGPSAAYYAAPFYTCSTNVYVATTGSDSNPGTSTSPWATLAHADSTAPPAGTCVNVAPGTYTANTVLSHGGSAPTPTGYVAYRCQSLDACHIIAASSGHLIGISGADYLVIEGFELDGNNAALSGGLADACVGSDNSTYSAGAGHHIWLINNKMHDCNLAGISLNNKEWYYAIHNAIYNNSKTSGYQGSGVGLVVVQCIESGGAKCTAAAGTTYTGGTGTYTPSGMDLTSAGFAPFHVVVAWNLVYGNGESASNPVACGNHTDGNGIIMDTFTDQATNSIVFPYQSLVEGNLSYSNGGRGIHVFRTSNVTVANNTIYGNGTDLCNDSYGLADLSIAGGANNLVINNIAVSVQTTNTPGPCASADGASNYCGGNNVPLLAGNVPGFVTVNQNNTYQSNLLYTIGAAPYGSNGGGIGVSAGQPLIFNYEQPQQITASLSAGGVLTVTATAGNLLAQGTYLSAGGSFGTALAEITSQLNSTASGGALGSTGTYQTNYSGSAIGSETMTTGVVLASQNKFATNPDLVSPTTNFALSPSSPASPAIAYGLTESYLQTTASDAGACPSSASQCP